ncbi:hypothetical protein TrispH2_012007 [Trichoplax sp. H2]|nr:hypothetical protein TrispH2_012007 [Trichoplax sp. H2]|eukprot:RDD36159.1 hypothetical protein TrispH2_012007 [Trichoplax sp. H2]
MADIKTAIIAAEESYQAAINGTDLDAIVNHYTDDARVLPPGAETISGKEAIKEYFASLAALGIAKSEFVTEECGGEGTHGFLRYSSKLYKEDGSLFEEGKGVVLYSKDSDGTWKIFLDVANSNKQ